jgi:TRAP-type mannitol/chloroaromatic compound transport system substrate-binding protein
MVGWFRNELRSANDLRGLKFRVSGLAGKMLTRLGVIPTGASRAQIAGAFESGALDAAGWVSPIDDEKLSLVRVAPWYYYPGWWQGSMAIHLAFNLAKWNALPQTYQTVVRAAAELANADVLARYDALNPQAVRRLVESGAKLRAFPQDVMEACWQASVAEFRDAGAADPNFQRVHDAYMSFRNEQYVWWQVAEYPYDNFIIRQRAKG